MRRHACARAAPLSAQYQRRVCIAPSPHLASRPSSHPRSAFLQFRRPYWRPPHLSASGHPSSTPSQHIPMSEEQNKDRSLADLVRDLSLSPSTAAARIEELCIARVQEASAKAANDADANHDAGTPGLESFLYDLWSAVIHMAEEDEAHHARLLDLLAELKKTKKQDWRVYSTPASLSELSTFGWIVRDFFESPQVDMGGEPVRSTPEDAELFAEDHTGADATPRARAFTDARQRYLRLQRFLARTWAAGLWPCADFALWMLRDALEYGPKEVTAWQRRFPRALIIEVAAQWAVFAGREMYACREVMGPNGNPEWPRNAGAPGRGGPRWKGVDGYDPERWRLWKETFAKIAEEGERENVRKAAREAAEAMAKVEEDSA
ncbi:hypothetical protein HDZ31DRAFT_83972 [Schizophyllum fasciatum]